MHKISRRKALIFSVAAAGAVLAPQARVLAQNAKRKILPKAQTSGGKPIMETLARRKSTRSFSDTPISEQEISNILWAAWGINRPNGMRTSPSARNRQNAALYAAMESGVWEYDAKTQELVKVLDGDQRERFGGAPLTLIYASEPGEESGAMLIGSMYQNVGLYCASAGLGNLVKSTGKDSLAGKFVLHPGYKIIVVQSIGWPR